jgi:hypothetical protein
MNYVNNEDFRNLLIKAKQKRTRKVMNDIGRIFIDITERYIRTPCFINYTDDIKNEMKSTAIFYMIKYFDRYDETKLNPLAYFTQIAFHGFLQILNQFHKNNDIYISLNFIENLDELNGKEIVKRYREIPKSADGNLQKILEDLEKVDCNEKDEI